MRAVILSAGRSVRMGNLAPRGCKVLTKIAGKTILRRQLDLLDGYDVTVVARTAHGDLLRPYPVEYVAHDLFDGPVGALEAAEPDGDTLVVYGDTLWTGLPDGDEWVGISVGASGRKWDVCDPDGIEYRWLDTPDLVCVGLYRVAHAERLTGPSMPQALRAYGDVPQKHVTGWRDVGTREAVASFVDNLIFSPGAAIA